MFIKTKAYIIRKDIFPKFNLYHENCNQKYDWNYINSHDCVCISSFGEICREIVVKSVEYEIDSYKSILNFLNYKDSRSIVIYINLDIEYKKEYFNIIQDLLINNVGLEGCYQIYGEVNNSTTLRIKNAEFRWNTPFVSLILFLIKFSYLFYECKSLKGISIKGLEILKEGKDHDLRGSMTYSSIIFTCFALSIRSLLQYDGILDGIFNTEYNGIAQFVSSRIERNSATRKFFNEFINEHNLDKKDISFCHERAFFNSLNDYTKYETFLNTNFKKEW